MHPPDEIYLDARPNACYLCATPLLCSTIMNAIQQKCRPKHQVLVLKCYPRTTKGAVDVKPNSSELSYLLFYAQSRRSKIQKVGSFLEKKTASDVWRQRIG